MNPLDEKVIQIASALDKEFWNRYDELTDNFPDTIQSSYLRTFIIQVSISTIVTNYLLGFSKSDRQLEVEEIVSHFRTMELKLRDLPDHPPDS